MLEQRSIAGIQELLKDFPALLPSHWFIASGQTLASIELTPGTSLLYGQKVDRKNITDTLSFHTNHFLRGRSKPNASRSWLAESKQRLTALEKYVKESKTPLDSASLWSSLGKLRMSSKTRKNTTLATIVITVKTGEVRIRALDHFSKSSTWIRSNSV
jgi:hypothetical protein